MGVDGGIEVGLTKKDLEMGGVKAPEKAVQPERRGPTTFDSVLPFIDMATEQLHDLDSDWEENRKEFPSLDPDSEPDETDEKLAEEKNEAKKPDITEIFPYLLDIQRGPRISEVEYANRNESINGALEKYKENPEAIGLEDLAKILEGEIVDIDSKNREPEFELSPFNSEWAELELNYVRAAAEALEIMKKGGRIKDTDRRAGALDEYINDKIMQLIKSRDAISDMDLYDLAENMIGVYKIFFDKTRNYEPPKKQKKKL